MATAKGRDIIVAFRKQASGSWGKAITLNTALFGIKTLGPVPGMMAKPEELLDEAAGQSFPEFLDGGNREVRPNPNMELRYDGQLWAFVAMVIGSDSTAIGTSASIGTMYDHKMDVQKENQYLFGTLCEFDGLSVKEIPSFKPTGFSLTGESGKFWTLVVRGIGDNCLTSGAANSAGSLGSVTYVSKTLRVPFGASRFRMNNDNGGALANSDKLTVTKISIEFNRDEAPDFSANGPTAGAEFQTQEPIENNFPECTLSVSFPYYISTTLSGDLGVGATGQPQYKKADLTITGPIATGYGGNYTITMSFPKLRIIDLVEDGDGANKIVREITCKALYRSAAPTGMTGIQNMVRSIVRNLTSAPYNT